ncbi:phage holin family protein [Crenalkalicoccus roseus]|uniref:phage holin family protein n=1 Tax=Crenalkalicoccus roseus TaxID=1485588 RepID=UPI00108115B0|nr:phage holin family protein [Crenalkalicoccus roseus]
MFRVFSLLRIAAQAEGLRWRRMGQGYAMQAGFAAGAAVFGLMLLIMLHAAAYAWLAPRQGAVAAALVIAAVDLVLAALLGWLAARHRTDAVAEEAERVRDDALRQVGDQTARAALLLPLLRSQSAKKGLIGAALTAAVVGLMARR